MITETLFYKDKPVFGLDIGFGTVKVMQIEATQRKQRVVGYGAQRFDSKAIVDGVIDDIETVAKAIHDLFKSGLIGDITTNRVVFSVPAARSYNRTVRLPKLGEKELINAVVQEIEQYVPVPITDLYYDHEKLRQTNEEVEITIVAVPKKIIDSYVQLSRVLQLDLVGVESTIAASSRLFLQAEQNNVPTVLIDFGSLSSDLTIFDNGLVVTGTVAGGGDDFTNAIASTLHVTKQEAHIIKTKYGLGVSKKQKEITESLLPIILRTAKEIKRMIRYYEERSATDKSIAQVVTMGGGANMPGLSENLTDALRLPVRMCDPWQNMNFSKLAPPHSAEKSMYVTVAGLALANPKELLR